MVRKVSLGFIALLLIAIGWVAAGLAQDTKPDFELLVNAPSGETTIECVRGCNLAWVGRGLTPGNIPTPKFQFSCGGAATRCSSSTVGGWVGR